MRKFKITPALIILSFGIAISLPATYHHSGTDSNGKISNIGLIAGGYTLLLLVLLILERIIIQKFIFPTKNIFLTEISIILLCSLIIGLDRPTLYLQVSTNIDWFGVFLSEDDAHISTEYLFPINKILIVKENNILFLNEKKFGRSKIKLETRKKKWINYIQFNEEYNVGKKSFCSIYCPAENEVSDSLLSHVGMLLRKRFP